MIVILHKWQDSAFLYKNGFVYSDYSFQRKEMHKVDLQTQSFCK